MNGPLGDVARFTQSVNFTFLITVGNLGSTKMQFWARSKTKIRNWKIINCFLIYMCQTLFTDKKRGKIISSGRNAFRETAT